jgi:hypothetical protein
MADTQPDARGVPQGGEFKRLARRRKVLIGVGCLLGVVVVCFAAILIMLQRLETRNANFQPPMTALERQSMLPSDPVLSSAPRLDGLRYGDDSLKVEGFSPSQAPELQFNTVPHAQPPSLQGDNLRANIDVHGVSQDR